MQRFDFGSSLRFGKLLGLDLKSGVGLGRQLPIVANYNRLELHAVSASFGPVHLSFRMNRPARPAKRPA